MRGVISLLRQLTAVLCCLCNTDHNKFSSLCNTVVVIVFPVDYAQAWKEF